MYSLFQILMMLLNIVYFIVIAHVVMSWLINFQVLNTRQPLVAQPIYSRIRGFLPRMSGLDLAPLILLVAIYALRIILVNNVQSFL
jgi:YggT family protein